MNRFLYPAQIRSILDTGIHLSNIDVNNWALTREQALAAISKLAELQVVILGGDVYIKIADHFELTYDNWSIDRKNSTETNVRYLDRSIKKSLDYITGYPVKDNVFFVLVPHFEIIPFVLPKQIYDILNVGIYLNSIDVNNWALTREQALAAISKLAELQIPILSGEIYKKTNNSFEILYDNWYSNKNATEADFEYLERSISKSLEYINNYPDENVFFGLVPQIEY
jgi:hypothetical protein